MATALIDCPSDLLMERPDQASPLALRVPIPRGEPITRVVSPSGLGETLKPFVFLDYVDAGAGADSEVPFHPHSGIATLTYLLSGDVSYEDTTGQAGIVEAGGLEWMQAGGGAWHRGGAANASRLHGFQLWVALPPDSEDSAPRGLYIAPSQVPQVGPARVLLGRLGSQAGPIPTPSPMDYFHVRLKDGQRWQYTPPQGYDTRWVLVHAGALEVQDGTRLCRELAIFREDTPTLDFIAHGETSFMLGAAPKHDFPLVLGPYSVHTNPTSLSMGFQRIREAGRALRAEGKLR
jgi:redox-sensitive bicupin YhaK (pirin superfamily)